LNPEMVSDPNSLSEACVTRGGLTAIARLPAVRIVVFDPLSNSFTFVTCPRTEEDEKDSAFNRDYLDRRRLALDTQKIRLLILPYNPLNGPLALRVSRDKGVSEFSSFSLGGQVAVPVKVSDNKTADEKKPEAPATAVSPEMKSPAQEMLSRSLAKTAKQLVLQPSAQNRIETETSKIRATIDSADQDWRPKARQGIGELLGFPTGNATFKEKAKEKENETEAAWLLRSADLSLYAFARAEDESKVQLDLISVRSRCISSKILDISQELARDLALLSTFQDSSDVALRDVVKAAADRKAAFESAAGSYKSCIDNAGFEGDVKDCEESITKGLRSVTSQGQFIDQLDLIARRLQRTEIPEKVSEENWADLQANLKESIDNLKERQAALLGRITDLRKEVDTRRKEYRDTRELLASPAMFIQRFPFSPLADDEVLHIVVAQGEAAKSLATLPDGALPTQPGKTNSLEIRSAPTFTAQLGMGVFYSSLQNPDFKKVDGNIGLASDGQKGVVPTLSIHHYWGRHSPLLRDTRFEFLAPTFSLGIPLAKSDILQEVLLGLNWELSSGIDLNVGLHYGPVKALNEKFKLGDPVPTGTEVGDLVKTHYDKAIYFGVILGRDIFEKFMTKPTPP
jgi:hypothetical protein